jgi:hypothetical protein
MSVYPISFWVVIAIILGGGAWSAMRINEGIGIPMLAVIGTVTVWYVGDAFYNGYGEFYTKIFDADVLQNAWWEVAWFLVVFLAVSPPVHRWFNARYLRSQGGIYQLARFGTNQPFLQWQLDILFKWCAIAYGILVLVAVLRVGSQITYFFFPFLGYEKAEPWGRGRIGSGFDALLSFAFYIQILVAAIFGVLAAVSYNRVTRYVSIILCFVSWPYFLFDRTRNTILAIVIPAVLSWVFLRLRGGMWKKVIVLGACYVVINGWMAFIIENRSSGSITEAFKERGFNLKEESDVHHQGLNMFEELSWINTFLKNGTYEPNWGARYFAELVNPIPRALWHNKPMIGLDYAVARGQGSRGGGGGASVDQGSVSATVSTGLIGQGVVNFGTILGPAAAALIMSFWVAVLARQDLFISKLGRLPLYAIGLILTFNLGRDITLITLYPFVFLAAGLWWLDRNQPHSSGAMAQPVVGQQTAAPAGATASFSQKPNQPIRRPFRKIIRTPQIRRKVVTRSGPLRRGNSPGGPNRIPPGR